MIEKINRKEQVQAANIGLIEEALQVFLTAHCDDCLVDKNDNTDETGFATELYKLGCRVSDDEKMLCPMCVSKKTIKINKK